MIRRSSGWLLPLVAALTFLPLSGQAQTPPPPPPPAGGIPGLTLTPAQKARFDARNAKFRKDAMALQADTKLTAAQKQAKFVALYKAVDTDMLAILTPAQRTTVLKQRAQMTQGQTLARKLNASLSPAQKTQIAALSGDLKTKAQQISADKSLSDTAKRARWEAAQQDAVTKIKAVLTPAQRADYEKMLAIQQSVARQANAGQAPH